MGWSKENSKNEWVDRHSPFNADNERALAEQELLGLSHTAVINLSGLWGGERSMRNYVGRVASSKEDLRTKARHFDPMLISCYQLLFLGQTSLHMIHGSDVARAILAVHANFALASGQRWILTDTRIYDWWDLASAWGTAGEAHRGEIPQGPQPAWVRELMEEEGVRALPREMAKLGRLIDGRDFWKTFGISPGRTRLE